MVQFRENWSSLKCKVHVASTRPAGGGAVSSGGSAACGTIVQLRTVKVAVGGEDLLLGLDAAFTGQVEHGARLQRERE
jgi:hypothetical protein